METLRTVKEYRVERTDFGRYVIMQLGAFGIWWPMVFGTSYATRQEAWDKIEELKS